MCVEERNQGGEDLYVKRESRPWAEQWLDKLWKEKV